MKKSILKFSVLAAIAATMTLFTSCSSDESVADVYVPEPVNFSIGMSDMSVKAGTRTQDAGTATKWTTSINGKLSVNDIVFIWMKDADGKFYRKSYKVSTAAGGAAGANTLTENVSGATGKFYWANKTEYKQYEVYSFGNITVGDSTNTAAGDAPAKLPQSYFCTVPADQTVVADSIEFLYGYGTLFYASSGSKALKVSHQLARIDVTLVTDKNKATVTKDQNGDALDIDPGGGAAHITSFAPTTTEDFELKIGWAEMARKSLFKPQNPLYTIEESGSTDHIYGETSNVGSWTEQGTGQVRGIITPRVLVEQRYNTSDEKFETQYSAVVMPQAFTGKDLFTIKYDGATYKYKSDADPFTIEPGKHYKYKVTLQGTNISVTVAIQNWDVTDLTASPVEAKLE